MIAHEQAIGELAKIDEDRIDDRMREIAFD